MDKQVIIGFTTEGPTDKRFLESVIQRTFEEVAFECTGIGELYSITGQKIDLNHLEKLPSYQKFKEAVRGAYRKLGYLHE